MCIMLWGGGENTHRKYTYHFVFDTGKCCDEGKSFLSEMPDSPAAQAYQQIIDSKCLTSHYLDQTYHHIFHNKYPLFSKAHSTAWNQIVDKMTNNSKWVCTKSKLIQN